MDEVAVLASLPTGPTAGKNLLIAVVILLVLGWWGWRRLPHPGRRFGRLPGDVHVEREGFTLWVPLASCLVLSLTIGTLVAIVRRFRGRRR